MATMINDFINIIIRGVGEHNVTGNNSNIKKYM